MRECFVERRFRDDSLSLIRKCDSIIKEYQEDGLRLTLRQLYYQLVSRNIITNTKTSYKNLGSVVSDARLAGLLDWAAIEDRGRVVNMASEWSSVASVVESALQAFRLRRWEDQPKYVELWVEKEALAGVLETVADEFHVALMVNKGYSSSSAMYAASKRYLKHQDDGKDLHLLYLGDHDPSGEDMVRDVSDRLARFGVEDLNVDKIALTMAQIRQYNPPPNPTKLTDSRANEYRAKHGESSWEVDALSPTVLAKLIRTKLTALCDMRLLRAVKEREEADKANLRAAARQLASGEGKGAPTGVLVDPHDPNFAALDKTHLREPGSSMTLCGKIAQLVNTTDNRMLFLDVRDGSAVSWSGPDEACEDCFDQRDKEEDE